MNDKVYVPNTFPTPNVLVDSVLPAVSASAFKILIVITRHTLGWGSDNTDKALAIGIAGRDGLTKLTGLSHQGVINGLRELEKPELILVKKGPRNSRTPNQYTLNLDITTGQLVKNLDQSKNLSSPTSQKFRPVLVKKVDSLKINTGNTIIHTAGKSKKSQPPDDPEFERAWNLYPKRAGDNPKERAHAAWRARVREGVDRADMIAGLERYAAYIRAVGNEETQYVKQAATFFGPDKHWREDWAPPQSAIERQRSAGGFVV